MEKDKSDSMSLLDYFNITFYSYIFFLGNHLDVWKFILGYLGIDGKLNLFSWYIFYYFIMIIILCAVHKILDKFEQFTLGKIVIVIYITSFLYSFMRLENSGIGMIINNIFRYIPISVLGYCSAESNIYHTIYDKYIQNKSKTVVVGVSFVGSICVFLCRTFLNFLSAWHSYIYLDFFEVVLLIFLLVIFFNNIECLKVKTILKNLGKHSFNLWILHAIFLAVMEKFSFCRIYHNILS